MNSSTKKTGFKDMVGQSFGRLTVVSRAENSATGKSRWNCLCECGTKTVVQGSMLRRGRTHSCGCYKRERLSEAQQTLIGSHTGAGSHPFYDTWKGMNSRVLDSQSPYYSNYGGRGITICRRWRLDMPGGFQNFIDDIESVLGPKPDGYSLDRVDNSLGYGPANVRWATAKEQNRNTRRNIWVVYHGKKMVLTDFAERAGVSYRTLFSCVSRHSDRLEYNANGDILVDTYLYPTNNVVAFRRAA